MRIIFPISSQIALMSIFIVLAIGCNPNEIATERATADKKAVGQWRLVGITSGWTGKTTPPAEKVELTIDQQQQGIIYENGKQVLTYRYTLEETNLGIVRYSIIQKTGNSTIFYPPARGNFRVSTKQLIIGDTGVDGNDYTFEKN